MKIECLLRSMLSLWIYLVEIWYSDTKLFEAWKKQIRSNSREILCWKKSKENNSLCKSVQFNSVAQSCLTLCKSMDCSTPGLPVHHQLLELTQTPSSPSSLWCYSTISSSVVPFGKVMSLLYNMLSRLVKTFIPRSKTLLISWLKSPSAAILEPPKIKSATVSTLSPSICHEMMGPDAVIIVFGVLSFKPTFSLSSFTLIKRLFSSSILSLKVVSSAYLRLLIFLLAILIPACVSSSPAFRMMYSACKLNKQGDNIQPWHTPFPIWNQSVVVIYVNKFTYLVNYNFNL